MQRLGEHNIISSKVRISYHFSLFLGLIYQGGETTSRKLCRKANTYVFVSLFSQCLITFLFLHYYSKTQVHGTFDSENFSAYLCTIPQFFPKKRKQCDKQGKEQTRIGKNHYSCWLLCLKSSFDS